MHHAHRIAEARNLAMLHLPEPQHGVGGVDLLEGPAEVPICSLTVTLNKRAVVMTLVPGQ